jgi:hypothetical protein
MPAPAHRPPRPLRAFIGLVAVAALIFNALLMLSDRAPGALRRIGGGFMRRLFERIDAGDRAAAVLDDPRLPQSDAIVHVAVWAIAVVLVGLAVWSWIGLLIGAVVVFAGSIVVEAAQRRYTDSRAVEASDIRANLAGVVLGTAFVALCYLTYSAVASLFRVRPRANSPTT